MRHLLVMDIRDCVKCGVSTPFPEGFYRSYAQCKVCVRKRTRAYEIERRKDPAYLAKRRQQALAAHFKKQYGLDDRQYQDLMEAADWKCQICGGTDVLCVDHCHESGKVRGILCKRCNNMLGQSLDNPETLRRAAEYLEK